MLLRVSRLALRLTKEAEEASAIGNLPGGLGSPRGAAERVQHGFEGRVSKPMVGGMRVRKTEGPRSYAPRLDKPSVSR